LHRNKILIDKNIVVYLLKEENESHVVDAFSVVVLQVDAIHVHEDVANHHHRGLKKDFKLERQIVFTSKTGKHNNLAIKNR